MSESHRRGTGKGLSILGPYEYKINPLALQPDAKCISKSSPVLPELHPKLSNKPTSTMFFRSVLLAAIAVLAVNASPIATPLEDLTYTCTETSVDGQTCKYPKADFTLGDGICLTGKCTPVTVQG
ncbi:hypothetical protein Tdes44962_MAKER07723 [Teratosphaeria destructans]|uniref:Uncharacterized protein n=1 Tax=Teratosphaeria destructans TaxID=418781 RepID=A0A9W7W5T6_9PEZI|nr:hypothetical protein Tdes44962_MAKER07723 [Teratosphaeria destructans]